MSTDPKQTTLPPLPTDLPARIRDVLAHGGTLSDSTALAAADEIERLREELKEEEARVSYYVKAFKETEEERGSLQNRLDRIESDAEDRRFD